MYIAYLRYQRHGHNLAFLSILKQLSRLLGCYVNVAGLFQEPETVETSTHSINSWSILVWMKKSSLIFHVQALKGTGLRIVLLEIETGHATLLTTMEESS